MLKPLVIVISGLPCTGKTALGKKIAQHFSLPFMTKDGFKERLFDELGWSDRAWSRKLGRASFKLLFYILETQLEVGRSTIIEGNFDPKFHNQILNNFQKRFDAQVFQIYCHTKPEVLLERFKARWERGERHPGHGDNVTLPEMEVLVHQEPVLLEIDGTTWNLDTTDLERLDIRALMTALSKITA